MSVCFPSSSIQYRGEAPKDYTKARQTIQSPNRLFKAPIDYTKPRQTIQSPTNIQRHEIPDKTQQYCTKT